MIESDDVFDAKIVSGLQSLVQLPIGAAFLFEVFNDRFDDDVAVGEVVE